MMKHRMYAVGGLALMVAMLSSALLVSGAAAKTSTSTQTVDLGGAKSAVVTASLRYGSLTFGPATSATDNALLTGSFTYSNSDWTPKLDYQVAGTTGKLKVESPGITDIGLGDIKDFALGDATNTWDLKLNPTVPTDLTVNTGAADSTFNLGGLNLTHLSIASTSGKVTADFTGAWQHDLVANISNSAGDTVIKLPSTVGVRIHATDRLTTFLDVSGLQKRGDDYVNDAYGTAPVTLNLNVSTGAGRIKLDVAQ